jgi:hypothetical protein
MRKTGNIVKERILAIPKVEPGERIYTKAMRAIWSRRSPNCEIIWPNQRRKKLRFLKTSVNLDIGL